MEIDLAKQAKQLRFAGESLVPSARSLVSAA